jgi:hypothetical protein
VCGGGGSQRLCFFEVGALVMAGQLGVLADRMLDLATPARTRQQKIEMLRERLRPLKATPAHRACMYSHRRA